MVYSRGGIPVGDYDPDRIVNLGDGHASWDNGFGYTYFNATAGLEFSAVSGLTYNFTNPHTDYPNHRLACRLGSFPLPLEAVLCRCRGATLSISLREILVLAPLLVPIYRAFLPSVLKSEFCFL
jgi:hypothetical protein